MIKHTIQNVTYEQLPQCLETIHKAFSINCEKYGFTKENYPSCAAFTTLEELIDAKDNGTHFYAVFIDGRVAGCVQLKELTPILTPSLALRYSPSISTRGLAERLSLTARQKQRSTVHQK